MTREEELSYLKNQAEAIKGQLEEIESRIEQLSTERK
jgi:prefoldin subunit 5